MQKYSTPFIPNYLQNLKVLKPLPTGFEPKLYSDKSIQLVLFDIYGTLLISESGDIDKAWFTGKNIDIIFSELGIEMYANSTGENEKIVSSLMNLFVDTIKNKHKQSKFPYPEVEIRDIWQIVLRQAKEKSWVTIGAELNIDELAFGFELLSNQVFLMPNAKMVINQLHKLNIPLGIVSNAQFYTPRIMNFLLYGKLNEDEIIEGFNEDLTVYSYKLKRGKPDSYLYKKLLPTLKNKYGVEPNEVLFVGNDMQKDILAASKAGFKTALFAGDKRSLRIRDNIRECRSLQPDFILTNLNQILDIF